MKTVLLFDTALATGNLGDEIIYEYVKQGLRPVTDDCLAMRLATHVENYNALQLKRGSWKHRYFCDADLKFVCGTNLITDNLKRLSPQWMVNPFNKKLYEGCILVGVGRTSKFNDAPNSYTQKLYQDILSHKYMHSVRDDQTKETLEQMGFKAINTGCPTLWNFDAEKNAKIPTGKAANAILTVSGYAHQRGPEYDQQLVDTVLENYGDVYAWIQTLNDEAYLDSLEHTSGIRRIYSLDRYAEILDSGQFDYIGTRLHGGVFALQHNVRSMIIAIDDRAKNFHKSNHLPILLRKDIDRLEEEFINKKFETQITVDTDAVNAFLDQFL